MPPPEQGLLFSLGDIDFRAIRATEERILRANVARNTEQAYRSSWKFFRAWCEAAGRIACPASPKTVQDFASWSITEGLRLETVGVRMNAIRYYHCQAGEPSLVDASVRLFLAHAKRELKEERHGKAAITYDHLRRIAAHLGGSSTLEVRNRAMILLTFASGWRRSEIVRLNLSDVTFVPKGIELWQRWSKTDQTAEGRLVGIEAGTKPLTCPVRALRAWLKIRGTWEGPLFVRLVRGQGITHERLNSRGEMLYLALKQAIDQIGEDPEKFGAHSLRAGMITEAAKHGASEAAIKLRTGHKCSKTLQRYIRPATAFDFNPLKGVL
jgi:integrase